MLSLFNKNDSYLYYKGEQMEKQVLLYVSKSHKFCNQIVRTDSLEKERLR
jgi:hypothetical protein